MCLHQHFQHVTIASYIQDLRQYQEIAIGVAFTADESDVDSISNLQ